MVTSCLLKSELSIPLQLYLLLLSWRKPLIQPIWPGNGASSPKFLPMQFPHSAYLNPLYSSSSILKKPLLQEAILWPTLRASFFLVAPAVLCTCTIHWPFPGAIISLKNHSFRLWAPLGQKLYLLWCWFYHILSLVPGSRRQFCCFVSPFFLCMLLCKSEKKCPLLWPEVALCQRQGWVSRIQARFQLLIVPSVGHLQNLHSHMGQRRRKN